MLPIPCRGVDVKEYTLDSRQVTALILVVLALLVIAFFTGVTVGERHERARERRARQVVISTGKVSPAPGKVKAVEKTPARPRASGKREKARGTAKSSPQVLKKGYYVQVGAFREKVWADKWQAQARTKGYRALVVYSRARNIYRVVIGPYASREEAVKVARKVDGLFKVRSSVVPDSRLR